MTPLMQEVNMMTTAVQKLTFCGFARLLPTAVPGTQLAEVSAICSGVLTLTLTLDVGFWRLPIHPHFFLQLGERRTDHCRKRSGSRPSEKPKGAQVHGT